VAFVSGLHLILLIGLVVVALGALAAVTLVRAKDFAHAPRGQVSEVPESVVAFDA
jgi:hypothetical protein